MRPNSHDSSARLPWLALSLTILIAGPPALAQRAASDAPAVAQATAERKALAIADYPRWRAIQTPIISEDGQWVALARMEQFYGRYLRGEAAAAWIKDVSHSLTKTGARLSLSMCRNCRSPR